MQSEMQERSDSDVMTRQGLEVRRRKRLDRVHEEIAKTSRKQAKRHARRSSWFFSSANDANPAVHCLFLTPSCPFSPLVVVYSSSANNNNPQVVILFSSVSNPRGDGRCLNSGLWLADGSARQNLVYSAGFPHLNFNCQDFLLSLDTPRILLMTRRRLYPVLNATIYYDVIA